MTQFYTYLHCKPDGTPFYVGKGHGKRSHEFRRRNLHHSHVIRKYGRDAIQIFVFQCESEEQAFADESHQIAQLRKDGYDLCNYTDGGEGVSGLVHSDVTRKLMSEAKKGKSSWNKGLPRSPEHSAKLSAALKGRKIPPEVAAKMSASRLGHECSAETREKIGAANRGKIRSAEVRSRISETQRGRPGRPISDETRAKISAANTGKVRTPEARVKMSAAAKRRQVHKKETV